MDSIQSAVGRTRPKWRDVLDVTASVLIILAAVTVVWRQTVPRSRESAPEVRPPAENIDVADMPLLGQEGAKVTVIEFSDFECPFCKKFADDALPTLKSDYVDKGKIQIAFVNLPLEIHDRAVPAAVAAVCAARQGRFWDMHDQLFRGKELQADRLRTYAEAAEVNLTAFDQCAADKTAEERVGRDAEFARKVGVRSTPTFFIGIRQADGRVKVEKVIVGARPASAFAAELDRLLAM